MIHLPPEPDDKDLALEPLGQATGLLIECEAALSEGRAAVLAPSTLAELSADELARFNAARSCLELLYGTQHSGVSHVSGTNEDQDRRRVAADPTDISGTRLGRFEVVREIGRGGQGVVFLARDPVLRREVALKLPRFEMLLTPEMRERFVREGRASAALGHPNVLTIYEANEIGPFCYLAQAYCPGPTLANWLRQQTSPPSAETAAAIVAQLADGVEHAHQRGIYHRDLKPSNVMLDPPAKSTSVDANPGTAVRRTPHALPFVPKLTDFGLAKILENEGGETAVGAVLGTAAYMSPEQATGQPTAGPATDVYGLGAILFELICRRPPYSGSTHAETLLKVVEDEPQWPKYVSQSAPADLVAICKKCLEKNPALRYPSARELGEDLRRYLAGEPTLARPANSLERLVKWSRRRPATAALVAISALSIVAIVTLSTWSAVRMAHERDQTRVAQRRTDSLLYASNMSLASNALNVGHAEQAAEYLEQCIPGPGQEDHREFAWGYLRDQLHSEYATFVGHRGEVFAVAFSGDGQRIFSGGEDGLIRIWDVETHKQVGSIAGHQGDVNSLDVSPDGKLLASAGDDRLVRIWEIATGALRQEFTGTELQQFSATFSPRGDLLAAAGDDNVIRLWETDTWQLRHSFPTEFSIHTTVFSPDGAWLAVSGKMDLLRLWNVDTGELAMEQKLTKPQGLAFSRDGSDLFFGESDGFGLHRIFLDRLKVDSRFKLPDPFTIRKLVGLHQDERILALCGDAGFSLWNYKNRRCLKRYHGHQGRVYDAAVRRGDDLVATAGEDGTIKLWRLTDRQRSTVARRPGVATMVLSKDGDLIAGAASNALRVWRTKDFKPLIDSTEIGKNLDVCFSPDNRRVAVGQQSGEVKVWMVDASRPTIGIQVSDHPISTVAFHPTKPLLACGGSSNVVSLWDVDKREKVAEWTTNTWVKHVHLTDDGQALLIIAGNAMQRIDLATGRVSAGWEDHTAALTHAAISQDESQIATFETDSVIRIWDAQTLRPLQTLTMHSVRADNWGIAFHPNGFTLATLDSKSLSIWDLRTGRCLINTTQPTFENASDLQFSPKGDVLYVTVPEFLHQLKTSDLKWPQQATR